MIAPKFVTRWEKEKKERVSRSQEDQFRSVIVDVKVTMK